MLVATYNRFNSCLRWARPIKYVWVKHMTMVNAIDCYLARDLLIDATYEI